jgi:hypothetical protein
MCPWCLLTPACPCRRGGGPPGPVAAKAVVAVAKRLRRFAKSFRAAPQVGRPLRPPRGKVPDGPKKSREEIRAPLPFLGRVGTSVG